MNTIKNRTEFHAARERYLVLREKDTRNIANGRRGWTNAAIEMCNIMDKLARYCVDVTKRGHDVSVCIDALDDTRLVKRYIEFLFIEKDLFEQWIDAVQLSAKKDSKSA